MIGVAQRTADDCGVACLATLLRWNAREQGCFSDDWNAGFYAAALTRLFPRKRYAFRNGNEVSIRRRGTSEYRMRRGLAKLGWKLSRKSGVPAITGERGLILSQTTLEFGCASHWLAWERQADGRIMVWNPQGEGELFEYKPGALHNRGLRLTWWANVTRKAKAQ